MADDGMMAVDEVLLLLADGEIVLEGLLPWSSNYTFLVTVTHQGRSVTAVYKPAAGERPLWDFDHASLCRREVAAYVLSRALKWPNVPPTVLRQGPHGPGSVQLFVQADHREHFATLRADNKHDRAWRQIALFDHLANNADRKGGHVLLGQDGRIWAIDHGLTFHHQPKLRTVIWDYAYQPITAELLADLQDLRRRTLSEQRFWQTLGHLLNPDELDALQARLDQLLVLGRFPAPGPNVNVPFPPV
jgi:uncharacterized repeat protein (TIGR03843 family)